MSEEETGAVGGTDSGDKQKAIGRGLEEADENVSAFVLRGGALVTLGAAAASGIMAWSDPAPPKWGVGLTLFLVYTASFTVGAFLGFLFGLPRARVIDPLTSEQAEKSDGQTGLATKFLSNSNLIKVSDWLTTIIIGLTLVNLGELVPAVRELGNALRVPLGNYDYSGVVGVAVAMGSVLAGFLLAYLWTSIKVRRMLEKAEAEANEFHAATRLKVDLLVGKTIEAARAIFAGRNLVLKEPPGAQPESLIKEQDPPPGMEIKRGSTVQVKI